MGGEGERRIGGTHVLRPGSCSSCHIEKYPWYASSRASAVAVMNRHRMMHGVEGGATLTFLSSPLNALLASSGESDEKLAYRMASIP